MNRFSLWCLRHMTIARILGFPLMLFNAVGTSKVTMRILQVLTVTVVVGMVYAWFATGYSIFYPIMAIVLCLVAFRWLPSLHKPFAFEKRLAEAAETYNRANPPIKNMEQEK